MLEAQIELKIGIYIYIYIYIYITKIIDLFHVGDVSLVLLFHLIS